MPDPLATLTRINLDDLIGAFGLQARPFMGAAVRVLFRGPAKRFARQMLQFDGQIGAAGIVEAARATERLYVRSVRVFGRECIPEGPVLFLSNHPGVTDTLAVLAALGRNDLRVIALDRPFLMALPNLSRHLLFVTGDVTGRLALARGVARHLRAGGAALTFPAGRNELDPDVFPTAGDSLLEWINSVDTFVKLVPELSVVPVCVRGVLSATTLRSPIVKLRRSPDDRLLLASALQLLASVALGMREVRVRVQFGMPIQLGAGGPNRPPQVHEALLSEMRRLVDTSPLGAGEVIV